MKYNPHDYQRYAAEFIITHPISALLLDMGFHQVRVRIHGDIARIEVLPDEIAKLVEGENREKIYSYLKQLGFAYVTLDLGGYRMGSMNETLDIEKK